MEKPVFISAAAFVITALILAVIWQFIANDELRGIRQDTAIAAAQAAEQLENAVKMRSAVVHKSLMAWRTRAVDTKTGFTRVASALNNMVPGILSISRIDKAGTIVWTVSNAPNHLQRGETVSNRPFASPDFEKSQRSGEARASSIVREEYGAMGLVVFFPAPASSRIGGTVAVTFLVDEIIENSLGSRFKENYSFAVFDAREEIFRSGNIPTDRRLSASHTAQILSRKWNLQLHPTEARIGPEKFQSLLTLLGFAVLLSAGVALSLYLCLLRQNALRHSEKRFRDVAEISPDWFWEIDDKLRFIYGSERFFQFTGFRPNCLTSAPLGHIEGFS